jgi:hypothetical protein
MTLKRLVAEAAPDGCTRVRQTCSHSDWAVKKRLGNGGNARVGGGADKALAVGVGEAFGRLSPDRQRVAQGGVAGQSTKKRRTRAVFQFAGHKNTCAQAKRTPERPTRRPASSVRWAVGSNCGVRCASLPLSALVGAAYCLVWQPLAPGSPLRPVFCTASGQQHKKSVIYS